MRCFGSVDMAVSSLDAPRLTAVHNVTGSRCKARLWRAEISRQRSDLFWRTEAILRNFRLQHGLHSFPAVRKVALPGTTREEYVAGSDRIHPNLLRGKLPRKVLRVVHQRGF